MDISNLHNISPLVRHVKISKSYFFTGEWNDYDNVFTYIEQGEADFILDGVTYRVEAGDAIVMRPFLPHLIKILPSPTGPGEPLVQYIVHFDLYYSEERSKWDNLGIKWEEQRTRWQEEMVLEPFSPIARIKTHNRPDLVRAFLRMYRDFGDKAPVSTLMLKAGMTQLLAIFLDSQMVGYGKEGRPTKGWNIIEKCIHHIHQHFHDPNLNHLMICNEIGFSTSHVSYLFKEQLGVTVHQYVEHIRIEQAKKRIIHGNESLTAISEKVGYNSIHSFSRAFKHKVGMTASHFMAAHSHNKQLDEGRGAE
jgi:AraC-like DNA-binding protein